MDTLYLAHEPIILLLDDLRGRNESNHWVTFLGFEGSAVVIYDSLLGIHTLSAAELMSRWSGRGVVIRDVSQWGSSIRYWQMANTIRLFLPAAFFVLVIGGVFGVRTLSFGPHHLWRRLSIAIGFVLVWILFDALTSPTSLLTSPSLRDAIRCHHGSINAAILREESVTSDAIAGSVVVDSRLPIAYAMGHLPRAINVPVFSSCFQIKEAMTSVSFDSTIVVYCQNSRCEWASRVAARLRCLGYQASILRDGIDGWIEQGKPMERLRQTIMTSSPGGTRRR